MTRKRLKSICPGCRAGSKQVRNGKNKSGTARARCGLCSLHYTLLPKEVGYGRKTVSRVIGAYLNMRRKTHFAQRDGDKTILLNPTEERLARGIARKFGISPQTVLNWLQGWPHQVSLTEYLNSFPIRPTLDDLPRITSSQYKP